MDTMISCKYGLGAGINVDSDTFGDPTVYITLYLLWKLKYQICGLMSIYFSFWLFSSFVDSL